jgi:hypothetical protein
VTKIVIKRYKKDRICIESLNVIRPFNQGLARRWDNYVDHLRYLIKQIAQFNLHCHTSCGHVKFRSRFKIS